MQLIDERETAIRLACSVALLRKLRREMAGPPVTRVGKLVRYDVDDLERWVETRKQPRTRTTNR